MQLDLITLIIDDYDSAIDFFVRSLRIQLIEDTPALTNHGRPKRWVVVRPPSGGAGLLLALADRRWQSASVNLGRFARRKPNMRFNRTMVGQFRVEDLVA